MWMCIRGNSNISPLSYHPEPSGTLPADTVQKTVFPAWRQGFPLPFRPFVLAIRGWAFPDH